MRGILLCAASVVVLSASANAADMYVPAASGPGGYKDVPYVETWAGFYAGVNGGYAWPDIGDTIVKTFPDPGATTSVFNTYKDKLQPEGAFGGGQIGYNLQRNQFVFGLEADIQGGDIRDSATTSVPFCCGTIKRRSSLDLNWFGTVRGRIGYAFDRSLVYATGGFAYGNADASYSYDDGSYSGNGSKSEILTGYSVGGGVEHKLSPAWSIKAEYQYINLGSIDKTFSLGTTSDGPYSAKGESDVAFHTVRVGLNYHIGNVYEPLK